MKSLEELKPTDQSPQKRELEKKLNLSGLPRISKDMLRKRFDTAKTLDGLDAAIATEFENHSGFHHAGGLTS